jgi:integrase
VCSLPIKPFNSSGFAPYIFTDKELRALFRAADSLKKTSYTQYRHVTLPIILRVLYGCGLRTSEVRALKRNEVDLDRGLLTIMDSKNGKDRLIPVSEELAQRLRDYDERIKALCPACEYFFPDCNGSQIKEDAIYKQFRKLIAGIGIPHYGRGKGPRVHDFRHTFAVHSMRQMEQAGMDLYTALPILSVYLGHGSITSTEKYLRLTSQAYPEIMEKLHLAYGDIITSVKMEAVK